MKISENGIRMGPEAMLHAINLMRRPLGIIIFGDETNLKSEVRKFCWENVHGRVEGGSREKILNLERSHLGIKNGKAVIVTLGCDSTSCRVEIVDSLQCLGAESVIGVFVEGPKNTARPRFHEFDRTFLVTA